MEQQASLEHLIDRFKAWKSSIKDLILFFKARQTIERAMAFEHLKLIKKLDSREVKLGETNIQVFKPWKLYALQTKIALETADERVSGLIIKRLVELKDEIKSKIKGFNTKLEQLKDVVGTCRNNTMTTIDSQEREKESRYTTNATPSSHHINTDPWISERYLNQQLIKMIECENKYQIEMSMMFREMHTFDRHVVEEMKSVIQEYRFIKKKQWDALNVLLF
jgi:hypothetical protein